MVSHWILIHRYWVKLIKNQVWNHHHQHLIDYLPHLIHSNYYYTCTVQNHNVKLYIQCPWSISGAQVRNKYLLWEFSRWWHCSFIGPYTPPTNTIWAELMYHTSLFSNHNSNVQTKFKQNYEWKSKVPQPFIQLLQH